MCNWYKDGVDDLPANGADIDLVVGDLADELNLYASVMTLKPHGGWIATEWQRIKRAFHCACAEYGDETVSAGTTLISFTEDIGLQDDGSASARLLLSRLTMIGHDYWLVWCRRGQRFRPDGIIPETCITLTSDDNFSATAKTKTARLERRFLTMQN